MSIAPAPHFDERAPQEYEVKGAGNSVRRGPLRFEEGIATDTDVPHDFVLGASQGQATAPGRPNRNAPVWKKSAEETMAERAHVGSASWVEAPTFLQEFSQGSFQDYGQPIIEQVNVGEGRTGRKNPATIKD